MIDGVHIIDDSLETDKKRGRAMCGVLGSKDDYLQFAITNEGEKEETYTLSFMLRFQEIGVDTFDYMPEPNLVNYVLPLKLVMLDENNIETTLKENIRIPYCCDTGMFHKEFYEISGTTDVPAGKTVRVQLKLEGDLPKCQAPDSHTGAKNEPHPIIYDVDNIAISSGTPVAIFMKKGETYQLQLGTVTDTIDYYTNSYLAQYTHNDNDGDGSSCTRFNTIVASVDEKGLITAETQGETALIAVITHEDGTVERKQCIIKVQE